MCVQYVTRSLDTAVSATLFKKNKNKISQLDIDAQITFSVLLLKENKIEINKLGNDTVLSDPGEISCEKPKALLLIKGVDSFNANGEAMWSNFATILFYNPKRLLILKQRLQMNGNFVSFFICDKAI